MPEQTIRQSRVQCFDSICLLPVVITTYLILTTKKCNLGQGFKGWQTMKDYIIDLASVESPYTMSLCDRWLQKDSIWEKSHMAREAARDSGAMFFVLFCFNNPLTQHITRVPQELPQSCSQAAFSMTGLSYNSARPPPRTKLPTHHPWRQTIPKPQQRNTSHFVFKARAIFYFGKNNFSRNPNRILCITLRVPKRMWLNTDNIRDWRQREGVWGN